MTPCSKSCSRSSGRLSIVGCASIRTAILARSRPTSVISDPTTERRVDGLDAMRKRLEPLKKITPPFTDPRYEIIGPKVDHQGDLAVLTFNVVNYGRVDGKPEAALSRWNSTEVYRHNGGKWRIVHSHWSRTQPDVKR